jgi:hypothetical protein
LLEQGLKFVTHGEIEQIMAGIQDTINRRRASGEYPAGLETELEAEFASILALTHRGEADRADALEKLLDEVKRIAPEVSGLTPTSSRVPLLNVLHKIVRRLIARQTRGLAAQQRAVNEQVIAMLEHIVDDARSREDADRRMVAKLSKHVLDRVAVVDHLYFIVAELETKLRKFEAGK